MATSTGKATEGDVASALLFFTEEFALTIPSDDSRSSERFRILTYMYKIRGTPVAIGVKHHRR